MGKRLTLVVIRLLLSANLLYGAVLLKFAGVPDAVALFTHMSQAIHGFVSQPLFRLCSGVFETAIAVLLLIPKSARLGAGLTVVWMTAVILSHIFVLGYGWFFVDALVLMVLAVGYLLLTRRQSPQDEIKSWGDGLPGKRTKNSSRVSKSQRTIRAWKLHLRSDTSLVDLSRMFNPIIRGWFQYYGRFYRSGLYPLRWYLNRVLARWAARKYKKLKHRFRRAEQWLLRVAQRTPQLFAHSQLGAQRGSAMGAV